MLDVVRERDECDEIDAPAREESYFAGARLRDADMHAAGTAEREQRAAARAAWRRPRSDLGPGHEILAGLTQLSEEQLDAVRQIACRLLAAQFRDVIAYGAGWTDRERKHRRRQRPHGPRHADAITAEELEQALADPDPVARIAQLAVRWAAAHVLHPDGVSKTTALGAERMARRLGEAMRDGDRPLRSAVWTLMRPMLSPRLAQLHADAFTDRHEADTTVDLAAHRAESTLDELDLELEPDDDAPAARAT